ncbi:SusD/RagB family nutrient-binding outer membrane lipoprotein [uncultured Parabacteroides sp.]|uniref:SusD/RagB family nutrient-binding outer membrane lipoprotein n=1 Tax=uncultured Parabacteroides sp. TaxID=512312 RepID=UPI0025936B02|nr:SusD/RagB family nutrient-binding outer membrane lipoprotein [uncultured Parabacteroides sp.]
MNKYIKSFIVLGVCIGVLSSCSQFEETNTNPNASTKVTPGMLATGILIDMTKQNQYYESFIDHNFMSKHACTAEVLRTYQYNKFTEGSFGAYGALRDARKMVESATGDVKKSYEALEHFIRAYKLFYLSLDMGDIPYSEALQGDQGNLTPKYDSQKEVMIQVLFDLDQANALFAEGYDFDGDPLLNGDTEKWQRVVNSFKLKVLINMYLHDSDSDLNIKGQFQDLLNLRPLMESNKDNLQLVYVNKANQIYPYNDILIGGQSAYVMLSSNFVDSLKILNDNRLFYFADPAKTEVEKGLSVADFNAYVSVDPSLPFNVITKAHYDGACCMLNKRYTDLDNPEGEPIMRLGYAEQCFNIAEAIVRGWGTGDAKSYYEEGVRAAMLFVKDHTPDVYVEGRPQITDEYISNYLSKGRAAFASDQDTQLKQIFQQKYFIYFLQNPWDGYYENRRTGYPVLPINPNTNMNQVLTQLPKRWTYPLKEYNENSNNLQEALDRQFGGKDENNDLMWILKK